MVLFANFVLELLVLTSGVQSLFTIELWIIYLQGGGLKVDWFYEVHAGLVIARYLYLVITDY